MYTIHIRTDILNIIHELGKFGDPDKEYFRPRLIKVIRVAGAANEKGSIIQYHVIPRFLSFSLELENIVQDSLIIYRVREGFAKNGILVFDIEKDGEREEYLLSIYVAFNFPRGNSIPGKIFWRLFRPFFPSFVHDVLWNHTLCKLKEIVEKKERKIPVS